VPPWLHQVESRQGEYELLCLGSLKIKVGPTPRDCLQPFPCLILSKAHYMHQQVDSWVGDTWAPLERSGSHREAWPLQARFDFAALSISYGTRHIASLVWNVLLSTVSQFEHLVVCTTTYHFPSNAPSAHRRARPSTRTAVLVPYVTWWST